MIVNAHLSRGELRKAQAHLTKKQRAVLAATRYRFRHPEKDRAMRRIAVRKYTLRKAFGITVEEYDAILVEQGGACAICGFKPTYAGGYTHGKNLAVDHDHATGRIRGLLCDLCNRAMGQFKDNADVLRKAIAYLERK